jgi:hypothetical protein
MGFPVISLNSNLPRYDRLSFEDSHRLRNDAVYISI